MDLDDELANRSGHRGLRHYRRSFGRSQYRADEVAKILAYSSSVVACIVLCKLAVAVVLSLDVAGGRVLR